MKKLIKKVLLSIPGVNSFVLDRMMSISHGEKGISKVGHRIYVGGMWDEMGKLQFDFLIDNGLKPENTFIDVACGSLRLGNLLIDYLEPGNYMGIDKEPSLIESGLESEVGEETRERKIPQFVISSDFEFENFDQKADFGIAQSLFTHLPAEMIDDCFIKLKGAMNPNGVFFATYFIQEEKYENFEIPHDHARFFFTQDEVVAFGEKNGWNADFIGEWNHPRDQQICKYTIK